MIRKERQDPLNLQLLDAMLRRLPPHHERRVEIEANRSNRMAGFKGELYLDKVLKKLPKDEFEIINDIRLPNGEGGYFQIDSLLITKMVDIVIETKNISGGLVFEKVQFIREKNNEKDRFKNPVLQARSHATDLKDWLVRHHLRVLPVEYFFVNSNAKTIVRAEPGMEHVLNRVCTCEDIYDRIMEIKDTYKNAKIVRKNLQIYWESLIAEHTPDLQNMLKYHHISPSEILTGVICPNCFAIPMIYKHGNWHCPKCQFKSVDAHLPAIHDFFLLVKPWITNAELRQFLHISSENSAYNIFSALKLPHSGTNRGRIYFPSMDVSHELRLLNFPLNRAPLTK